MTDRESGELAFAESSMSLADIRTNYDGDTFDEMSASRDPIAQFSRWMQDAIHAKEPEPTAMTVATIDARGRPSSRVMLLKGVDEAGFVFFTNYDSRKARDLGADPRAALAFFWPLVHRQVRVEGVAVRVPRQESVAYFSSRPRDSQLGAWASPQSEVLPDRAALEQRLRDVTKRFEGQDPVPTPDHWGGYRVVPDMIEFWQGRPNRLHDRLRYTRQPQNTWRIDRLAP